MTLWPKDTRRPALMVMGMMVFCVGVSFAYTFVIHPADADSLSLPTEFWRWSTTGLLSLIALMIRMGWKSITKEFNKVNERMDSIVDDLKSVKETQTEFALAVTDRISKIEGTCKARHGEG